MKAEYCLSKRFRVRPTAGFILQVIGGRFKKLLPPFICLGFNSDLGSTTGENSDLSGAGDIDTAPDNQRYPDPGKKRGQGAKE